MVPRSLSMLRRSPLSRMSKQESVIRQVYLIIINALSSKVDSSRTSVPSDTMVSARKVPCMHWGYSMELDAATVSACAHRQRQQPHHRRRLRCRPRYIPSLSTMTSPSLHPTNGEEHVRAWLSRMGHTASATIEMKASSTMTACSHPYPRCCRVQHNARRASARRSNTGTTHCTISGSTKSPSPLECTSRRDTKRLPLGQGPGTYDRGTSSPASQHPSESYPPATGTPSTTVSSTQTSKEAPQNRSSS